METALSIVSALGGTAGIWAIVWVIINIRSRKRKEAADAGKAEAEVGTVIADNDSKAVETLKEVIDELRADNREKAAAIDRLTEDRDGLQAKLVVSASNLCLHLGCAVRRPERGKGTLWLDQHKDEVALDVDYLPINQLLRDYGAQKKQNNNEIDTDQDSKA